jgi:hypothetical protein
MLKFLAKLFRKPANKPAADMPRSRKHIRVTHWTFDVRIAYYDHAGRKVTYRRYPTARASAMIKSARAKGYKVVGA